MVFCNGSFLPEDSQDDSILFSSWLIEIRKAPHFFFIDNETENPMLVEENISNSKDIPINNTTVGLSEGGQPALYW